MDSGIYCIQNKINGKVYVGSAVNLNKRKDKHFSDLKLNKHRSKKLQNSYTKHGLNTFEFFVLEYCEKDKLIECEQFYLDTLEPWYNTLKIAGNNLGYKHTEEARKKLVELNTGKNNAMYGRKHSEKTKKLMSRPQSQEQVLQKSKSFKLISPTGELIDGVNLRKFCRENNIDRPNLLKVLLGKKKSCKGYTAVEVD